MRDVLEWQHPLVRRQDPYDVPALLDTLAVVYDRANKYALLFSAVVDQRWMQDRFTNDRFRHDAYLDDLALASGAAARHDAVGDALLIALARASVGSLAAAIEPALICRALETQQWPAPRAASVADQIPDPKRRLEVCLSLMASGVLSAEENESIGDLALTAALAHDERTRTRTISRVAPLLRGEPRRQGFELALAASNATVSAPILRGLARAPADALSDRAAEAIAASSRSASEQLQLLQALAPCLRGEAVARVTEIALASDDSALMTTLKLIADRLTDDDVEALVARAENAETPWDVVPLVQPIRQRLSPAQAERALGMFPPSERHARVFGTALLAARLTGPLQDDAVEEALAGLPDLPNDELAVSLYVSLLDAGPSDAMRRQLVAAALPRAERIENGSLAVAQILRLAGDDEGARRSAARIAAQLHLDDLEPLLDRLMDGEGALAAMEELRPAPDRIPERAAVLAASACRAPDDAVDALLEAALKIHNPHYCGIALAALAPRLDAAVLAGLVHLTDVDADVLVALAPVLDPELRQSAVIAANMIPRFDQRARALASLGEPELALRAAELCADEGERETAWVAVAPRLSGKLLDRALTPSFGHDDLVAVVRAGVSLAASLPSRRRRDIAAWAFERCERPVLHAARAEIVAAVAPWLRPQEAWRALQLVDELDDHARLGPLAASPGATTLAGWKGKAMAALAPRLPADALASAVALAARLPGERSRAEALAALAPRTGISDELADALDHCSPEGQIAMLTSLVEQFDPDQLANALDFVLAEDGVESTTRAAALEALAPRLSPAQLDDALRWAHRRGGQDGETAVAAMLTACDQDRAVEEASRIADYDAAYRAMSAVAQRVHGQALLPLVQRAKTWRGESNHAGLDALERIDLLAALAPGLEHSHRADAIGAALTEIQHVSAAANRSRALGTLARAAPSPAVVETLLAEPDPGRALAVAAAVLGGDWPRRAVAALSRQSDPGVRAAALAQLASFPPAAASARHALLEAIAACDERSEVLALCRSEALTPSVVSPDELESLLDGLLDVCEKWRWP